MSEVTETAEVCTTPPPTPGPSIQPVVLAGGAAAPTEEDDEAKKPQIVPGIKIIGISSDFKTNLEAKNGEEGEEEDDDDEESAEDEDGSSVEDEEDSGEEGSDDDEEGDAASEDFETPAKIPKTPKVTIRKVMQESTPGGSSSKQDTVTSTVKKRGRPSKADILQREKEREEAMARGEPDPDLKRKRRKPNKLADGASSEEESKEEKKRRKREEKEEKKRRRKAKSEDTEDSDEEKPKKKKGRQKKILNEEEMKEREVIRKEKYQIIREKQKAKLEKRKAYLIRKRDERKAQKQEEKARQEAHNTRMAELRMQYLDDNAQDGSGGPGTPGQQVPEGWVPEFMLDENSQNSITAMIKKKKAWGDVSTTEMAGIHNPLAHVTAETLFEYKWPLEGRNSEHFFLQEQVTEFLQVKSFKRKYPDCGGRKIWPEERDFLIEMKIVNETQADLGLTAIPSSSVLDIMCQDFYDHYEDYYAVVKERKERSLRNVSSYCSGGSIKSTEAVKLAANYNRKLNEDRQTNRTAYFDLQTFTVHYPRTNKGRMRVVKKEAPGIYPVAMIPGQFVDHYKMYDARELKHFPLNSVTEAPLKPGQTLKDLPPLGSEGSESETGSSSSGSSSGSDSDSDSEQEEAEVKPRRGPGRPKKAAEAATKEVVKKEKEVEETVAVIPKRKVDEIRPMAMCKNCQGDMGRNKLGQPEMLLHCTKCNSSCHPTCVGLSLELIKFVTNYDWVCTDCKQCMTCQDPADEDKMLFCDLCDRGYHIYCVGLESIPSGRWHCGECSHCESCGSTSPTGEESEAGEEEQDWVFETKQSLQGNKIYSHTMCGPCHKQWKKGNFCPECNGVFGSSCGGREDKGATGCWVCSRLHHSKCVGLDNEGDRYICSACQKKTQEKIIAGGRQTDTPARPNANSGMATPVNQFSRTPVTASYSRSGRRVTQINFANQF